MGRMGNTRSGKMRTSSLPCFGVGDGLPCGDRHHASFLYRFGKTSILLDCGEPIDGSFKAGGLGYDLIDSILVSHLHADHIGGFLMLMQGCWLEGRRKDLTVHMPGAAISPVRQMMETALLFDELLKFRLRFAPLKAGRLIRVRDVRITPFPTTHLDGLRARFQKRHRGAFDSYCFLLESGRRRIGHSADLGSPEDLEPLLARPLDLLVCEMAHFTPEEILSRLRGRRIKRIAFVHLARGYWEALPKIRRLAARMLPDIPHTFAKDGAVIQF
jgi:ribonuclease BN (tRNA processing enzyme)